MKLTFLGAAKQVTGSMYLLTLQTGYKILVDCGMDYETKKNPTEREYIFPFNPVDIDLVILTHAHIDHSGNLPALVNLGFKGHILSTPATADLTAYLLFDSANIQFHDYRKNLAQSKKTKRHLIPKPLFIEKQVKQCMDQFLTLHFNKVFELNENVKITLIEAGHLLGAASVLVEVKENNETKRIGFSGDLGRNNSKLVRNGKLFDKVNYLISESTYGGRKHKVERSAEDELLEYITDTCIKNNGRLVIPAFSVGRTQSIVFTINQLKKLGLIPAYLQVFIDSPLAVKTTDIYQRYSSILNEEAQTFMATHGSLFEFEGAEYLQTMAQHNELMKYYGPCIIISAAGMVEGGRIQEHVSNNIENAYSTILIAGFCSEGTLGHRLLQGQASIRIKNKDCKVKAKIAQTDVFSSHPDHNEVFNYITKTIKPNTSETVFLVHGNEEQLMAMKAALNQVNIMHVEVPNMMQEYTI